MSTVTQAWIKAWNEHEVEKLIALHDEHARNGIMSGNYLFGDLRGFEEMARQFFSAFPDLHLEVLEKIEEKGKAAVLWVATGTHKGKYNNIPPTGKKLKMCGTSFLALKDNKIIKSIFLWDEADMLRQMGLLPEVRAMA